TDLGHTPRVLGQCTTMQSRSCWEGKRMLQQPLFLPSFLFILASSAGVADFPLDG
ncbi:hypothetical protein WUBG_07692, partial [Wuchereria bancrofti]